VYNLNWYLYLCDKFIHWKITANWLWHVILLSLLTYCNHPLTSLTIINNQTKYSIWMRAHWTNFTNFHDFSKFFANFCECLKSQVTNSGFVDIRCGLCQMTLASWFFSCRRRIIDPPCTFVHAIRWTTRPWRESLNHKAGRRISQMTIRLKPGTLRSSQPTPSKVDVNQDSKGGLHESHFTLTAV